MMTEPIAAHLPTFVMAVAFCSILPLEAFGVPPLGRVALSVLLTVAAGPSEGALLRQIAVGAMLAIPAAVLVEALAGCVEAIETARGQNMAQVIDPLSRAEPGSLPFVVKLGVWWSLLDSGLLLEYCKAFSAISRSGSRETALVAVTECASLLGSLMSHALSYLWPFAVAFLLLEMAGAIIIRIVGISSVSSELFALKAGIVFLTLALFGQTRPLSPADVRWLVPVLAQ